MNDVCIYYKMSFVITIERLPCLKCASKFLREILFKISSKRHFCIFLTDIQTVK